MVCGINCTCHCEITTEILLMELHDHFEGLLPDIDAAITEAGPDLVKAAELIDERAKIEQRMKFIKATVPAQAWRE